MVCAAVYMNVFRRYQGSITRYVNGQVYMSSSNAQEISR